MKKMTGFLLAIVILSNGCAQTMVKGARIDPDRSRDIHKGKTTKQEVLDRLGTPTATEMDTAGNEKLVYTYVRHVKELPGMLFVPFIQFLYLYSWETAESQSLTVVLKDDVVLNYSYHENRPERRKVGVYDYFFKPH